MDLSFSESDSLLLDRDWQLARTSPDSVRIPAELVTNVLTWHPVIVPGTVAQVVLDGDFITPSAQFDLDDFDWWYQCDFSVADLNSSSPFFIYFGGLATLAQVWLNDELILHSKNMFLPQRVSVGDKLQLANKLVICFRSVTQELKPKRARPRWKTNLVKHQQLRWLRTTLLGRIPGWSPSVAPVGPWRSISIQRSAAVDLLTAQIGTILSAENKVSARFTLAEFPFAKADLIIGDQSFPLAVMNTADGVQLQGEANIPLSQCWWPHTHGKPVLLPCKLQFEIENRTSEIDLGLRGFKHLDVDRSDNQLSFLINGEKVFCRGACWTIANIHSLDGDESSLRNSLTLARDAGINMLRIGATMIYESDTFYRLCDELGIMVWQDFMFANMDYPIEEDDFFQNVVAEAQAQISRLARYACVTVYCGNSEVQQQAAMMGQPRESWSNSFFDTELKTLCARLHQDVVYFPSTPCEGILPFNVGTGLSHYYGVGAYKRPLNDAIVAAVKFTPETLGFSHIPEPGTIDKIFNGALLATHHPKWKQRVPRDSAAGWDFEDIRDYYLALLFNEDAVTLRSHNPERYLELSRVVTGEVIQRVFAIWRSEQHPCQGALIWFYKDLWPGAGWGILDSDNQPKAAYFAVKRAAKNVAAYFLDRGLDGLQLSLINETAVERELRLQLQAFKSGHIQTLNAARELRLSSRSTCSLDVDGIIGHFSDLTYSYRFGPRQHDVVVARLCDGRTGELIHEDFYFPVNYVTAPTRNDGVIVEIIAGANGATALKITSPRFLQYVRLDLKSHAPEDNYFHLSPDYSRVINLHSTTKIPQPVRGYIEAVNLLEPIKVG